MRSPAANQATAHPGWRVVNIPAARPRIRVPGPARLGVKGRLALLAVAVMALSLAAVAVWNELTASAPPAQTRLAPGTAFLGSATCSDWREAGVARRMTIVRTLAVAATQPDPENPGATLAGGLAYGHFQRVCSHPAADSALLYESYNRAASFQSVRGGAPAISGSFGTR
jgi:hypothetical protein